MTEDWSHDIVVHELKTQNKFQHFFLILVVQHFFTISWDFALWSVFVFFNPISKKKKQQNNISSKVSK